MLNRIFLNLQSKLRKRIRKSSSIYNSVSSCHLGQNELHVKKHRFHLRATKVRIRAERFVANHSVVSVSEY